MDSQLETQIKERFAALPEDVRRAVQSSDLEETLHRIGEVHHLHIDQMGTLGDEVRLVMLGFADPDGFAAALTRQANISSEEAQKIAEEVSDKIFTPIRESMKQFMEEREMNERTNANAVITPPNTPTKIEKSSLPIEIVSGQVKALPQRPLLPMAEKLLTGPTSIILPAGSVSIPQLPTSPQPRPYKTDPYLEPTD